MRFDIFPTDRISSDMASKAYMTGIDHSPWRRIAAFHKGRLEMVRTTGESGNVHVYWPVEKLGPMMVSTAWLMERDRPYLLPLELIRGKMAHLRRHLAGWESIGLHVPELIRKSIAEEMVQFREAVVFQSKPSRSAEISEDALPRLIEMGDALAKCYIDGAMMAGRRFGTNRTKMLGVDLGATMVDDFTGRHLGNSFNAAMIVMPWHEIEASENRRNWEVVDSQISWAKAKGMSICAGPLLFLDKTNTPDWLCLFENDFEAIRAAISQFVEAAINRYRGQVDLWLCSKRTNLQDGRVGLGQIEEDELVQLTAQTIEQVKSLDPGTPRVVSFDRPWSEYVAESRIDFPPWFFADALIRGNMGLTGVMLEINFGYDKEGSLPRDLLDTNELLDYWGMLGVPVYLNVTAPSSPYPDPLALLDAPVILPECTTVTQNEWVQNYLPLFMAKPNVKGVFWGQLHDMLPHEYPHGGLFDGRRSPKPILSSIEALKAVMLS
jgi:Glycosyl hydrolase family 10